MALFAIALSRFSNTCISPPARLAVVNVGLLHDRDCIISVPEFIGGLVENEANRTPSDTTYVLFNKNARADPLILAACISRDVRLYGIVQILAMFGGSRPSKLGWTQHILPALGCALMVRWTW